MLRWDRLGAEAVQILLHVTVKKLKDEVQLLVDVQYLMQGNHVGVSELTEERDLSYGRGRHTLILPT